MTKKYLVTKDQIQTTVGTSEFPPSSTAVKTVTDAKLDTTTAASTYVPQTRTVAGKALSADITIETGDLTESTGFPKVTSADKAAWDAKVSDVKINGTSVVTTGVATLTITDNVTSTSTAEALSANQGKVLNDRINSLSTIGRYLSQWNCSTGLPATNPTENPYTYKSGDYYVVGTVATAPSKNYKPTGTQYDRTASTTEETAGVSVGDVYHFDGTSWTLQINHVSGLVTDVTVNGVSVLSGGTAAIPAASTTATGALTSTDWNTFNGKQDAVPAGTAGEVLTNSGTAGTFGTSIGFDTAPTASSDKLVKSGAIKTALDAKQDSALVTTWQTTVDDTHYPSEKLVKGALDAKLSVAEGTFTIGKDTNGYYLDE